VVCVVGVAAMYIVWLTRSEQGDDKTTRDMTVFFVGRLADMSSTAPSLDQSVKGSRKDSKD